MHTHASSCTHTPTFAHGHTDRDTLAGCSQTHHTHLKGTHTRAHALTHSGTHVLASTCTRSCTPIGMLGVRLHAHRHWHALEHVHTHVVCDRRARPPRLGHSKTQELPPPLLPNLVTICLVRAKAPAVSPAPLGNIRVLMFSALPGPWVIGQRRAS